MADLLKLAKENKVTEFEKEWANQNSKPYPLNTNDGMAAQSEYNRLRSYDTNTPKPTAGPSGTISKAVSTQGFTTGFGMISAEAANELIGADQIANAAISIGTALFSSKPLKDGLKDLFTTGLGNLFEGAMNILEKEVELRNKLNAQIGIGGE
jgi:hypothetical protein